MARWQALDHGVVVGRLDHHFVRPDPIHPVEEPLPRALQLALDAKGRELVRNNTDQPAWSVGLAALGPEGPDLVGRARFLLAAEHARAAFLGPAVGREIGGPSCALGG